MWKIVDPRLECMLKVIKVEEVTQWEIGMEESIKSGRWKESYT